MPTLSANKSALSEWLKSGSAESRQYFFVRPGGGGKDVELSCLSPSLGAEGVCVYFLRTTSKTINVKTRSDGQLLTGTVSKGSLIPVLESCISSVYCPAIAMSSEWDRVHDAQSERGSLIKKGGQFCEVLTTSMLNLDDGVELPLPEQDALRSLEPDDDFDALIEDKAMMDAVRQSVAEWVQNIHRFVDEDRSYVLQRSESLKGGPKEEINWWSKRNLVLTKTQQTLSLRPSSTENDDGIIRRIRARGACSDAARLCLSARRFGPERQPRSGILAQHLCAELQVVECRALGDERAQP